MFEFLGLAWLIVGLAFVMWRAHKAGALVPMIQGAMYGLGAAAFLFVGFYLLSLGAKA